MDVFLPETILLIPVSGCGYLEGYVGKTTELQKTTLEYVIILLRTFFMKAFLSKSTLA